MKNLFVMLLLQLMLIACIPDVLKKYTEGAGSSGPDASSYSESAAISDDPYSNMPGPSPGSSPKSLSSSSYRPLPSQKNADAISVIDPQTFRFKTNLNSAWDNTLQVLLKNYHISILDKKSGIITTDWDRYYIGEQVYRNRITLHFKPLSWNMTQVTVHNSVEVLKASLSDGEELAEVAGGSNGVWLPTPENNAEVRRIIKNMAILLRMPAPQFQDNSHIAKSPKDSEEASY
ncbi:MAG: hypothetical protein KBD78_09925 [Oligoflexales bacterium]|nr:hypothetical protein [Oligoflexales bacterium]